PAGLSIMGMLAGDELASARLADADDHILMVTENGQSIRFKSEIVPSQQRGARGVIGIKTEDSDRVVAMDVGKPKNRLLLVISKFGFGKKTKLSDYPLRQTRGGKGVKTLQITAKTGPVADAQIIDDTKEEVYVVSEQAQVIRTSLASINVLGRATQGVTIIKPSEGDSVASISCVSDLQLLEENAAKQSATPKAKKPASTNGRRNGRVNGAQSRLDGIE
ncbi:MAG: DNA gyrase subunit A, partial [Dehalococcoidia bacterium]|nr:DNA gyrase subunit A [Dehalococcoidia bacterium]